MEQNKSTISSRVHRVFSDMQTAADLKRNKLALYEYHMLPELLHNVINKKQTEQTIISGVAEWCKRNGLTVKEEGIGWEISL